MASVVDSQASHPGVAAAPRDRARRRHFATAGIALALIVLWLVALASYRSIAGFDERMRSVAHTQEVLAGIHEVSASYAQARVSWFAYLTRGETDRRERFETAVRRTFQQLGELKRLTADNPLHAIRLQALEERVRSDFAALSTAVAQLGADPAVLPPAKVVEPPLRVAEVLALVRELAHDEEALLEERRAEYEQSGAFTRAAIALGYGACLLVLIVSFLYLRSEIAARSRAQAQIATLNRELGERHDALQESVQELESFTYSVSHDLRAPLRGIHGFAQILQDEYGHRLDAEGIRLLGVVRNNAARMGELIDDLLAFSRIGRQSLDLQRIDMPALVAEVLSTVKEEHEGARAEIRVGELPEATGDVALVRQVWVNLIGNALKYSSKVARPVVTIAGYRDGRRAVYSVEDNGAGFDMKYADKLFGVFQRLHHASEFPGTGVGLAIVARILSRHEGQVFAQGKVNEGACFTFVLPIEGAQGGD